MLSLYLQPCQVIAFVIYLPQRVDVPAGPRFAKDEEEVDERPIEDEGGDLVADEPSALCSHGLFPSFFFLLLF